MYRLQFLCLRRPNFTGNRNLECQSRFSSTRSVLYITFTTLFPIPLTPLRRRVKDESGVVDQVQVVVVTLMFIMVLKDLLQEFGIPGVTKL